MTPPRTRRRPLACVMTAAALAAGALIAATAVVPQRARAQDSGTQAAPQAAAADGVGAEAGAGGSGWCARIPPGFGHPPANLTPLALRVLDPSIEPVQTTDGLIHLAYIAQVTNTQTTPADIASVVPVDALAGFAPTGRNSPTDAQGNDVAGQVELFATAQFPGPLDTPSFTASVPAGNAGLMFFDVTYTDPAQIPRLLSHAITLASPNGGAGTPALTNPVPVGCKQLAVLHPPLVGQGWLALHGCCRVAYHRTDALLAFNGTPHTSEEFAIDYIQVGPNGTCCYGPVTDPNSWYDYGSPVLAAAPGVVVSVTGGIPDNNPVGTLPPFDPAHSQGNNVVEDVGAGRYVFYAHLQPGSIPASVRAGARLGAGDMIGRLGNSGGSAAPHLHFQVADKPLPGDASGLPFAFDAQMLEGSVPEGILANLAQGAVVPIDRTGAGLRRDLYPARNGVFGYDLPP